LGKKLCNVVAGFEKVDYKDWDIGDLTYCGVISITSADMGVLDEEAEHEKEDLKGNDAWM
jgi:hypothetical protein